MLTKEELKIAKKKYNDQKSGCNGRIDRLGNPIEMRLTFEEWLDIWLQSGHWHERGRGTDQYVMSRINDVGHYKIGNIIIKTSKENAIEGNNSIEWRTNNKLAREKTYQDPVWQKNVRLAGQKRSQSSEWQEIMKLAREKRSTNLEWRENVRLAGQKRAEDNSEWRENVKVAAKQRSENNLEWRENNGLQLEQLHKSNCKSISCDGIIYESRKEAAIALAPNTTTTTGSKLSWFTNQLKKHPSRFFYVE